MAQRRMFSKEITNSSEFLMMSASAQALYLHIGMNSDDDGFCEIFSIVRMTESKPDDVRLLHEKGFIFIVDNKVCIVKDWHTNNNIQADRYTKSKYLKDPKYLEIYKTIMSEKVAHLSRYIDCIQPVSKVDTQLRLGKDSIGKVKDTPSTKVSFDIFWDLYPKKVEKKKTESKWNKLDVKIQEAIIADLPKRKLGEKWSKDEGRFIEMPTTYLNGERWNDEIITPSVAGAVKKFVI